MSHAGYKFKLFSTYYAFLDAISQAITIIEKLTLGFF